MKNRTLITWFMLGHFANDWPVGALWLIVPAVGIVMDLSPTEVGLLFTICNVGAALAYLPAGILTDHVSNRGRLLLFTFWWVGIGYLLASMAPDFWSLAILLAIAGMGDAAWHPIATAVLTRENRDRRAYVLGIHAVGGSMAEVLSPLVVGVLLAYLDWRAVLALSAVPTLMLGVCFIWVARAIPPVKKNPVTRHDLLHLLNLWRKGNGLRMMAMICFYNMALMALFSMIPLYLASVHQLEPWVVGLVFSAMLVIGALVQPWIGNLSDIIGRKPVVVTGCLAAGLACLLLIFLSSLWVIVPAMIAAIAGLDAIRATVLAGAVDHSDHREGATLGFAFALLDGIGAFGALLAGIAASLSWQHMFGLAGAFALCAAALAAATFYAGQASKPSQEQAT
ncbi:MFS transporter [Rhodovibrionaceae bacterium A322]